MRPRNTSSCCAASAPTLVQPAGAARDEKARAGSEGRRRFCFYLICPAKERERERGVRWGTRLSQARPPFLGTLQDTPRPYLRKVVQSSTLDRADADTRPPPPSSSFPPPPPRSSPHQSFSLSSISSSCPSCRSFSTASSYRCCRTLYSLDKASRSGPRGIVHSISRYSADHRRTYRTFSLACQRAARRRGLALSPSSITVV